MRRRRGMEREPPVPEPVPDQVGVALHDADLLHRQVEMLRDQLCYRR